MAQVTIHYYASARAAAGVMHEVVSAETVADALADAQARHGEQLARVLSCCSLLLDGVQVHCRDQPLPHQAQLDVLPPFAGG